MLLLLLGPVTLGVLMLRMLPLQLLIKIIKFQLVLLGIIQELLVVMLLMGIMLLQL
jgi:hypothetical protein